MIAKRGDKLIQLHTAQSELFDKLSYVDDATVVCGIDNGPSRLLLSGVDRETGVMDQLYTIGFLPASGFGQVNGPND